MAHLNFNAREVEPDTGRFAVPAGWYNVMMDESKLEPTKKGDGERLNCRFSILDGSHKGQKLFVGLNLKNPNPVSQEIAYKQLSAIAHAVGVMDVQDSAQLHDKPLKVKVKFKPADLEQGYDEGNDITAYRSIDADVTPVGSVSKPTTAAKSFTPVPPAGGKGWEKPAETSQPWANKTAPTKPAPAPAPEAQPATAEPVYVMTESAEGFTREEYHAQDWSDEDLLSAGHMVIEAPAAPTPAAKPAPKAKPTPKAKSTPVAEATVGAAPPWAKKA